MDESSKDHHADDVERERIRCLGVIDDALRRVRDLVALARSQGGASVFDREYALNWLLEVREGIAEEDADGIG